MVAAIPEAASTNLSRNSKTIFIDENPKRPPLLPSEKNNGSNHKKPKSRQVSTRYLSSSPSTSSSSNSRRFPSPLISRNSTAASSTPAVVPKRSVSVDLRRPFRLDLDSKLRNAGEVSAAKKLLVTSSRRLSVSFQGEAFWLPICKTKVAPGPASPNLSNARKSTLVRRGSNTPLRGEIDSSGDQVENWKPIDQHRPLLRRQLQNPMSDSFVCTSEEDEKNTGYGNVISALQRSMNGENMSLSLDSRLSLDLCNAELSKSIEHTPDCNLVTKTSETSDITNADTDGVSLGSTSGGQDCKGVAPEQSGPRGVSVSATFWQESNSQLKRLQDPGAQLSTSPGSKMVVAPKFITSKKLPNDGPLSSPLKMASPTGVKPASLSKLMTAAALSPCSSRFRNSVSGTIGGNLSETPSVLSFSVDIRRGKVGENRLVNAHLLRLLHNQQLQWRFVNAKSEATFLVQEHNAEKNLWNAWITVLDLRDSVTKRRHRLQLLKQKLKLASILKGQVTHLEDSDSLDKDHTVSLLGLIDALKASTLRLPVVGAFADIQSMKQAISSAIDVMHTISSSTCLLLSKVKEMNSLVAELVKVTGKEWALLEHCKDFFSVLAALQVKHCSLRTGILQKYRVSST